MTISEHNQSPLSLLIGSNVLEKKVKHSINTLLLLWFFFTIVVLLKVCFEAVSKIYTYFGPGQGPVGRRIDY